VPPSVWAELSLRREKKKNGVHLHYITPKFRERESSLPPSFLKKGDAEGRE